MSTRKPDAFLGSRDFTGDWARVRACWIEARLCGPYNDQYARVAVHPPAPPAPEADGEGTSILILAPHSNGTTVFPLSELPLPVYVYRPLTERALYGDSIEAGDVVLAAWCELYATAEEAAGIVA